MNIEAPAVLSKMQPNRQARLYLLRLETRQSLKVRLLFVLFRNPTITRSELDRHFLGFIHSPHFFRALRWPYAVITALELTYALAMVALDDELHAAYPLMTAVLFGTAAALSWIPRAARYSMVTLTSLGMLSVGAQYMSVCIEIFKPPVFSGNLSHNSTNESLWCMCDVESFEDCPQDCQYPADIFLGFMYVLPLVQDITIPITLLVLGLPFYLYLWLFGVSVVSWLTTVAAAFVYSDPIAAGADMIVPFAIGVLLYPMCFITAVVGERARRRMFLKLCSLRNEERHLLNRAKFRGYRQVIAANWKYLMTSPPATAPRRDEHVIASATI